ncbi:MAG: class I SAM-dependent methyltransferase [Planctomycetaceae bacterium]|nr:class I SAM-dependent methyltransferase [Planctomycetaceae bacterium]
MDDPTSARCPLCQAADSTPFARSHDREYHTSADVFAFWHCPACDVVFLDNPPVTRLREIYPANYYSYCMTSDSRSWLIGVKELLDQRLFRKHLAAIPGDELAVLDVGGGSGWLLSVIRDSCSRVKSTHEVDLDETAGASARAQGHQFHSMRIEDFQSPHPFDLIVMLNLIEHVESPTAVLKAMSGLLSANGRLIIKTPNFKTLDCRLFGDRWGGLHCPRHWVLFTRESLIRLAAECGLRCVEASYTQGGSQWAGSILGWLSDLGCIRINSHRPMWRHPLFKPVAALTAGFDLLRAPWARTAQMHLTFQRSG